MVYVLYVHESLFSKLLCLKMWKPQVPDFFTSLVSFLKGFPMNLDRFNNNLVKS